MFPTLEKTESSMRSAVNFKYVFNSAVVFESNEVLPSA